MISRSNLYLAVLLSVGAISPALAQQPAAGTATPMPGMPMRQGMPTTTMSGISMPGTRPAAPGADASPSTKAFKAADDKMMADMGRPMTGNADRDFVAGMLPHHQGAVDMAKVELQYGKDAELRRLARGIVAAQEKEITQMRAWQAKRPAAR